MNKTLIVSGIMLTTILSTSAADLMRVTNVQNSGNSSKVSVVREYDGHVFFTGDYNFTESLTLQQAVNKIALYCDNNITAMSTNTTPVKGRIQEFAIARMDAWYKGGVTAYFVVLAQQLDLMK